jgi:hypothetical protein
MKLSLCFRPVAWLFSFCALGAVTLRANDDALVTAVFSRVHDGYTRHKNPDGTYKHETYVVAKGGYIPGLMKDHSIDPVPFSGIMRTMAPYLAQQNYLPAANGQDADLLLVVYWGTTVPFDGAFDREFINQIGWSQLGRAFNGDFDGITTQLHLFERLREQANQKNANLLGYLDEINDHNDITRYVAAAPVYYDLIAEIEEPRYFVVVGAYDFQEALRHDQKKLLWSTRVSIRAQGNRFDERLSPMLANASRYFGEASGHLVRRFERTPHVDYGELKSLGVIGAGSVDVN